MRYLSILLLCCSCIKTPWKTDIIAQSNISSLTYDSPTNLLSLEFLKSNEITCFINSQIKIQNPIITLTIDGNKYVTKAFIRSGNQKIALDKNAQNIIVNALTNDIPVYITVEDIEEKIDATLFPKFYKKFLNSNSIYNKLMENIF